jgi:5-methylthioadenosine/S-adenosylhomocysteine deaminase
MNARACRSGWKWSDGDWAQSGLVTDARSILLADVHLIGSADSEPIVCDLYVEDGLIASIDAPGTARQAADVMLQCSDHVAIPGLANLHLHCRPGRALSDGLPVPEWHRRVDLISRHMTQDDSYVGGLVAFGELLLAGVTTCAVMTRYFTGAARAAEALGLRAVVVPLAGDGGGVERGDLDDLESSLQTVRAYRDPQQRVQLWPGFDSPLTTTLDGMREVSRAATESGLGIHTHMAETMYEVDAFKKKRNLPESRALKETGILGHRTLLAHCNWLADEEIQLLSETSTSVVHNPTSNMRFASGVCRVLDLREAGVKVALGTDGMLSSFELNMFSAMRTAARLHRMSSGDSAILNSKDVLEMSTSVPAAIVGTGAGRLEPGAPADITVLNMTGLHLQPYRRDPHNDTDLTNLIVWCGQPSDVQHVICGGEVVVRDRELTRVPTREVRRRALETDARLRPLIG